MLNKETFEKKAPYRMNDEQVFTKDGEVRQTAKLAKWIWKQAEKNGTRLFGEAFGEAAIRVDFHSGRNHGLVKVLKVTSHCRKGNTIEYLTL